MALLAWWSVDSAEFRFWISWYPSSTALSTLSNTASRMSMIAKWLSSGDCKKFGPSAGAAACSGELCFTEHVPLCSRTTAFIACHRRNNERLYRAVKDRMDKSTKAAAPSLTYRCSDSWHWGTHYNTIYSEILWYIGLCCLQDSWP